MKVNILFGGKAGQGALIGAGTNVIGGALLDTLMSPPQQQPQPVYYQQRYEEDWGREHHHRHHQHGNGNGRYNGYNGYDRNWDSDRRR